MTVDRLARQQELFERALDVAPVRRDAFVERECAGDAKLLAVMRDLLAAHAGPGSPIDASAKDALSVDDAPRPPRDVSVHTCGARADDFAWAALLEQLSARGPAYARYVVQGELARGGMGVVHRVYDADARRVVAMKRLLDPNDAPAGEGAGAHLVVDRRLGRFLEEAQVTSQLNHPGIVPVHEIGVDDRGRAYFTMEMVRGEDLRHVLDKVRKGEDGWNTTRALTVLLRVCEAVAFAHDRGVIHRDLKPSNVMVGRYGEVYVMDWGLARVLSQDDTHDVRIRPPAERVRSERDNTRNDAPRSPLVTMDGDVIGTPAYMAPEQARGERVGPAADVYGIGAILYHLLTGRPPYSPPGTTPDRQEIWQRVQSGSPPTVSSIAPSVSSELDAICDKAMAHVINDRYPSVSELADDLRAYLELRVVSAYATGPIAQLGKWVARNRAAAGIATALFAALLFTGWLYVDRRATLSDMEGMKEIRRQLQQIVGVKTHDDLTSRIDELWPASPDQIRTMEEWLRDAKELTERLSAFRSTARELLVRGTPQPTGEYSFDDDMDRWWHETLGSLITGIEELNAPDEFGATIANVEKRLAFARTIRDRSITRYQQEWDAAITAIADRSRSGAYDGLVIREQLGLVPLGPNPASGLWEFWHVETGARPKRAPSGEFVVTGDTGLVLVLIPGGAFLMGAQSSSPAEPNHDPLAETHESTESGRCVRIALDPFFLSKYEMTQGQWEGFTGANPSWFAASWPDLTGSNNPVDQVTWIDGDRELRRLGLVLPTEAQWEYACRARTSSAWSFGAEMEAIVDHGNTSDASFGRMGLADAAFETFDDGHGVPAPVGSFRPNAFGLLDMHGNLWEWCKDGYRNYDAPPRPGDGERVTAPESTRIARGGGWKHRAAMSRSATRSQQTQENHSASIGVRPARTLDP